MYVYHRFESVQRSFHQRDSLAKLILARKVQRVRDILEEGYCSADDDLGMMRPLHLAVLTNDVQMTRCILSYGAQVDARDQFSMTPLHYAARRNCNISEVLLSHGAEVDCRNHQQLTPLHLAVRTNQNDVVLLLLRHGCDVDAVDHLHETALHSASRVANLDCLRILLEFNADPVIVSFAGRIALDEMLHSLQNNISQLQTQSMYIPTCLALLSRVTLAMCASKRSWSSSRETHLQLPDNLQKYLVSVTSLKLLAMGRVRRNAGKRYLPSAISNYGIPDKLTQFVLLWDL